ncbi:MAG: 4Fe-4S dicluster domain-containing protein, partial [Alphaproteobacteria bacterium]
MEPGDKTIIDRDGLAALIDALAGAGYVVIGPVMRDGAILYDEIAGIDDLPAGWGEDQDAGRYRLRRRDDDALFAHSLGPHSWKRYLLPPRRRLWRARRDAGGQIEFDGDRAPVPRYAFLG